MHDGSCICKQTQKATHILITKILFVFQCERIIPYLSPSSVINSAPPYPEVSGVSYGLVTNPDHIAVVGWGQTDGNTNSVHSPQTWVSSSGSLPDLLDVRWGVDLPMNSFSKRLGIELLNKINY